MKNLLKTYTRQNGDIQRVQLCMPPSWDSLHFLSPAPTPDAALRFAAIYRQYLVPACPWIFGSMVLFSLPQDVEVPFPLRTKRFGAFVSPLASAAAALRRGMRIICGKPVFFSKKVKAFWQQLESRGCVHIVAGKLPFTRVIPVSDRCGFLTGQPQQASLKVNASFFIMDPFDCATPYDQLGTPLGLCVKDGVILNPPLFGREALLVSHDGTVAISAPDVRQLTLKIGAATLRHGENATFFTRPEHSKTPAKKGVKLVIIGREVAAVSTALRVPIPASGFVVLLHAPLSVVPGDKTEYLGMENVRFGIQVGNSIIKNGQITKGFLSRFYNIRRMQRVSFPPCLYPLDFENARAARISLGADKEGQPMLLWAEGAPKLGYRPGAHSTGASLAELGEICAELGMANAINLDGGGSAQLLVNGQRSLALSDRRETDLDEMERPIPLGLAVY